MRTLRTMIGFTAVDRSLAWAFLLSLPLSAASLAQTSAAPAMQLASLRPAARERPSLYASFPGIPFPAAPLPGAIVLVPPPPCPLTAVPAQSASPSPCFTPPNPYHRFLDSAVTLPLTPEQKAHLALHNLKDPGNLVTIVGTAGFTVGTNAHTAYGPGWKGFGRNVGYSFLQDATGEFFGTFLIPSVAHEDPHYHRMPNAGIPRRFVHAVSRTLIAQSDYGRNMPNYSTLLTNPICAEIGNLYVPGIRGNGPSTVARIMTGYATDPIGNLITEFLPDLARHIHIQVIFAQRILNPVSTDQYSLP